MFINAINTSTPFGRQAGEYQPVVVNTGDTFRIITTTGNGSGQPTAHSGENPKLEHSRQRPVSPMHRLRVLF